MKGFLTVGAIGVIVIAVWYLRKRRTFFEVEGSAGPMAKSVSEDGAMSETGAGRPFTAAEREAFDRQTANAPAVRAVRVGALPPIPSFETGVGTVSGIVDQSATVVRV